MPKNSETWPKNSETWPEDFKTWLKFFLEEDDTNIEELSTWDIENLYDIFLASR